MITTRPAEERGHADHGWLDTYYTFSFDSYHDRNHMGYRSLRVINEDRVKPGKGFGKHPHRDMEIITYVLSGALEHEDSMGNGSVIKPGDVQRMSAGSGVFHSEFNPSASEPVHLIQIWILPGRKNIKPSYEQKHFTEEQRRNGLCLIASPDGSDGSVRINQDARVFASILNEGTSVTHKSAGGRAAWVQVLRGSVSVEGTRLNRGDGAAITDVTEFTVTGNNDAEILLFDLA